MSTDHHLSIGEVLALLQEDFPDVTISKIRFLETQGLITPGRTSSGYRKFYDQDLERLRWILTQQKENFLPLKVIKDRLDDEGHSLVAAVPNPAAQASLTLPGIDPIPVDDVQASAGDAGGGAGEEVTPSDPVDDVESESKNAETPEPEPPASTSDEGESAVDPQRFLGGASGMSMTPADLAAATGLDTDQIVELDAFGLIQARATGREKIYGEESLTVCRLAAAFAEHGVEARHLRMYKVAAEREAGVFEQVLMPLARHQAAGRSVAAARLAELAGLGDGMREAMLRQSLAPHLL